MSAWWNSQIRLVGAVLVCLIVSVWYTSAAAHESADHPMPSLAPMLEKITPAVVNISTTAMRSRSNALLEEFFGVPQDQRAPNAPNSLGSGVIVDAERGLVVTNYHVIENASEILVTLADGRELIADVVGNDPKADIALLRVTPDSLDAVRWADSDELRVGDFCVAIGNPFGLGQTVTSGIVSALGRSGLGIEDLEDFIQTDASINPGNSGGALVNLKGELIGINTAIVGPAGGNVGIGFAIPANMAQDIVEQLLEYGEVRRGMLGIAAQALTPDLIRRYGLKRNYGVVIVKIERGSPAEKSGLQLGDIIVAVNNRPVKTVESVINRLGLAQLGEELTLRVLRDNKELDITTTVALIDDLSPLLSGTKFDDAETTNGQRLVVISSVRPGSKVDQVGLQAGDLVLAVDDQPVTTVDDMREVIDKSANKIVLLVQRARRQQYVEIR